MRITVIFLLTLWFRKLARKVYRIVRTKVSSLNTFLSENISGMKLIQLFAREDVKAEEFRERTGDLYKSQMRELKVMSVFRPVIAFLSNLALAFLLWRSGVSVLAGTLTLGTMYVFSSTCSAPRRHSAMYSFRSASRSASSSAVSSRSLASFASSLMRSSFVFSMLPPPFRKCPGQTPAGSRRPFRRPCP